MSNDSNKNREVVPKNMAIPQTTAKMTLLIRPAMFVSAPNSYRNPSVGRVCKFIVLSALLCFRRLLPDVVGDSHTRIQLSNWELRVIAHVNEQLSASSPNVHVNPEQPCPGGVGCCGRVNEKLVDVCLRVAHLISSR